MGWNPLKSCSLEVDILEQLKRALYFVIQIEKSSPYIQSVASFIIESCGTVMGRQRYGILTELQSV